MPTYEPVPYVNLELRAARYVPARCPTGPGGPAGGKSTLTNGFGTEPHEHRPPRQHRPPAIPARRTRPRPHDAVRPTTAGETAQKRPDAASDAIDAPSEGTALPKPVRRLYRRRECGYMKPEARKDRSMRNQRCVNCFFVEDPDNVVGIVPTCHRYAPRPRGMEKLADLTNQPPTYWPGVDPDTDWCGEWKGADGGQSDGAPAAD